MGIIARVYDFINGTLADADQVDTELNTLFAEINGNLDNNNIKALAAIVGTKIATTPNGIPTDRINDLAVTTAKIADLNVTTAKVADANITKAKVNLTTYSHASAIGPINAGLSAGVDTGLLTATTQALVAYLTDPVPVDMYIYQLAGTWRVNIHNSSGAPVTIDANELKVLYIS